MDPLSVTASILTLLTVAGASSQFLFNFIHDIADAPTELRLQNAKLQALQHSITHLLQVYSKLPHDCQIDPHFQPLVVEFTKDIDAVKSKIEAKHASLGLGRGHRMWARCQWISSDRQLKKFFSRLSHWDTVFSNALKASEFTILMKIESHTSLISGLQSLSANVPAPSSQQAPTHTSLVPGFQSLPANVPTTYSKWAPAYTTMHLQLFPRYHVSSDVVSIDYRSGPAIVQRWPRKIQANYRTVSGSAKSFTIQLRRFIPSRLSIVFFILRRPKFNIGFNVEMSTILPYNHPCYQAIENGDVEYIKRKLSSREIRPSDINRKGDTLLHIAAQNIQSDVISLLIAAEADVNAANDYGCTPLHKVVDHAILYEFVRNRYTMKPHLRKDPAIGECPRTLLVAAECSRRLLAAGADLCQQNVFEQTPLHTFFNQVSRQIIQSHHEDIDGFSQDYEGRTIMHYMSWSYYSNRTDLERFLITNSSLSLEDNNGRSMLHYAALFGNLDMIEFLLTLPEAPLMGTPDYFGSSVLHYATRSPQVQTIDILLQRGFDFNGIDHFGRTVLHQAALYGNLHAIKRLLELGAAPQLAIQDEDHRTPLQLAIVCKRSTVVKYLQEFQGVQGVQEIQGPADNSQKEDEKPKEKARQFGVSFRTVEHLLCIILSVIVLYFLRSR